MSDPLDASHVIDEDRLRADLYSFLATLLTRPPNDALLKRCRALEGDDTPLGQAIGTLSVVARAHNAVGVEREFNRLFIGIGRGEILPFASVYMTGFLNEKPLAALRNDMMRLGVERQPDVFEPEDNIGSLCEMMAGLITGRFGPPASLPAQFDFFSKHIGPWAEHFFSDLEAASSSVFFAPVGAIGRMFMEIEKDAFRLAGESAA
ncbi:MAG: molecular chaperone TorD family protein [Pseudomonadota bacterium]